MFKRVIWSLAILLLACAATTAAAQDQTGGQQAKQPLSPPATAEGTIGGKKITIKYSAPSMRGRKIMGELVPYGKVWRTGANEATTLTTDADLMIGNVRVPRGQYTLFTLPGENGWKLIINKQTGQWGTKYDESQDLARVDMNVKKTNSPVEKFVISIDPSGGNSGVLRMMWENKEVSVPIQVEQ